MAKHFSPATDWLGSDNFEYKNTFITSHIEIPDKILRFGTLGKVIPGFEKKMQEENPEDEDNFGDMMSEEDVQEINVAMPGAHSSDEENEGDDDALEYQSRSIKSEYSDMDDAKNNPISENRPQVDENKFDGFGAGKPQESQKPKSSTMNVSRIFVLYQLTLPSSWKCSKAGKNRRNLRQRKRRRLWRKMKSPQRLNNSRAKRWKCSTSNTSAAWTSTKTKKSSTLIWQKRSSLTRAQIYL